MLFNSIQFLIFFPAVVILFWILPSRWKNPMLLIASYYFYMNWQPAFGLLLLISTLATWGGALLIDRWRESAPRRSRIAFRTTLIFNLAMLFVFKYLQFVGDEIRNLLFSLGVGIQIPEFTILLPVGISFFIFQAVGYLIDVRRATIAPERNLGIFALFIAFFPQLVAGPIERAANMLPQFRRRPRFSFDALMAGLELMALGYFMKIVIAENISEYVDAVYIDVNHHNGTTILLATFFFCFQIFADFGGYSLIAIGAARCMDFRLTQNFRQPYLATSVRDFWRRWHVSLSRWLSDYVYIPLGGNRVRPARHYLNIFLTLFLSGVWHGADYTFMAWGAYHGSLQCLQAAWHKHSKFSLPDNMLTRSLKIAWTFFLVLLGRVFFRADNISDAMIAFKKIFTEPGIPDTGTGKIYLCELFLFIIMLMAIEIRNEYFDRHPLPTTSDPTRPLEMSAVLSRRSVAHSALFLAMITSVLLIFGNFSGNAFIYFQF